MVDQDLLNEASERLELERMANILEMKLTPMGALNLLAVAIRIAPRDLALQVMSKAIMDLSQGQPLPEFMSFAEDAQIWAMLASSIERKYYAAAILNSFTAREKANFLGYAERLVA